MVCMFVREKYPRQIRGLQVRGLKPLNNAPSADTGIDQKMRALAAEIARIPAAAARNGHKSHRSSFPARRASMRR